MFRYRLQISVSAFSCLFLNTYLKAEDPKKEAQELQTTPEGESSSSAQEIISEVQDIQAMTNSYVLSSGFGFIRAFQSSKKGSLRANGLADVKLSYHLGYRLLDNEVYAFLHYLPFSVGLRTDDGGIAQEYEGVLNTYMLGGEMIFLRTSNIDYLASLALGFYQASVEELIPIKESDSPVRRYGGLIMAGGELRYKVMERFHIGPRLQFATGGVFFYNLLFSSSFYF